MLSGLKLTRSTAWWYFMVCVLVRTSDAQILSNIQAARVCVTAADHNRPQAFPGLGDFIGWPGGVDRMPNGDLVLVHSAGYWHSSFAQPRQIEPQLRQRWLGEGWPLDFAAPTGGRSSQGGHPDRPAGPSGRGSSFWRSGPATFIWPVLARRPISTPRTSGSGWSNDSAAPVPSPRTADESGTILIAWLPPRA